MRSCRGIGHLPNPVGPAPLLAGLLAILAGCASGASTAPSSVTMAPSFGTTAAPGTTQPGGRSTVAPSNATGTASLEPAAAPATLEVTCDGSTTGIPTPVVRTRPDGIHIHLANVSGRALTFGIEDQLGGEAIPVGGITFVSTVGPGTYRLACTEGGSGPATFTVVDPDRLYTPIECDATGGGSTTGAIDYAQGATGPKGDLVTVARMELRGLLPGDVVERAGYPDATGEQWVRVVRDGHVLTVVAYSADGHGGWLISRSGTCPGSDVTLSPPG